MENSNLHLRDKWLDKYNIVVFMIRQAEIKYVNCYLIPLLISSLEWFIFNSTILIIKKILILHSNKLVLTISHKLPPYNGSQKEEPKLEGGHNRLRLYSISARRYVCLNYLIFYLPLSTLPTTLLASLEEWSYILQNWLRLPKNRIFCFSNYHFLSLHSIPRHCLLINAFL
jgi:hypothetical protein